MSFFRCQHCGNIITFLVASGVPVVCCGEPMTELQPGTVDASLEKHVPVVVKTGNTVSVTVGTVEHPMVEAHYIQWIVLETKLGFQYHPLSPGQKPHADFALTEGDDVVAAYEYCNLHGLWKA